MAKKKATFRSTSRRLALEPRLLFDGAAAIAGADALDNHNQQEGQKDNAAHATPPAGESTLGATPQRPPPALILLTPATSATAPCWIWPTTPTLLSRC